MQIRYETKPQLTFIGYHTDINPEEGYEKCPQFWEKEYAGKYAKLFATMSPENAQEKAVLRHQIGKYGICLDTSEEMQYWIAGSFEEGEVPEGFDLCTFPAGNWTCFSSEGPIPQALQSMNTEIFHDWMPTVGVKLGADPSAVIEVYSPEDPRSADYHFEIWMQIHGEIPQQ